MEMPQIRKVRCPTPLSLAILSGHLRRLRVLQFGTLVLNSEMCLACRLHVQI